MNIYYSLIKAERDKKVIGIDFEEGEKEKSIYQNRMLLIRQF